eukprot:CAMPEP_0175893698 /NCGR_PEP_ID=MMETSP0107_2-20121207/49602_1 /TAXON_ID=195067 ORGANISM="Goniomonas pacifica, Strain CCMP1869" /NCGR_SAMPLE_ID=MMETSP0107_2 /ASSEMBLY_ACC=CAM_ASM_000203 /LENGTH=49 /DNA_ID= /DNA_START= /DNA_END= /DNA_ORIENTATION=
MRPVRRNTLWMFPQVGVVVDLIVFVDLDEGSSQRSHLQLGGEPHRDPGC